MNLRKEPKEGGVQPRSQDCYFYYSSTCARGPACPFRHEPTALASKKVCTFWRAGNCTMPHCTFRHLEIGNIQNKKIPCIWESQPQGCKKPYCPFLHLQSKNPVDPTLPARSTPTLAGSTELTSLSERLTKVTMNTSALPLANSKMVKHVAAGTLVLKFLQEFFKAYDSDNRQNLLDAYHENAVMSLSIHGRKDLLAPYVTESRNLLKVRSVKRRHDLLHKGKLQVVAFLSRLPKTEHDMNTFTLDVPFTGKSCLIFTVTGRFREKGTNQTDWIRQFNRCFVVVPQGSGFCIINETFFVSIATKLASDTSLASSRIVDKETGSSAMVDKETPVDKAVKQRVTAEFSKGLEMDAC